VAFNYRGQRAGRPHLATWAEAGITVAAELLAGNDDVRPRAADMLRRAVTAIPAAVTGRPRLRADSGYFTADLAHAADELGCDYAVAAKRNTALWRAYAAIPEDAWVDAKDMPAAQVTAIDYAPAGWPDDAYTIVRRVRIDAKDISTDPRARRRRTIPADQLTLALDDGLDQVGGQLHRHQHPVLPAGRRRRGRGVGSAAHRHRGPHPRRQTRRGVAAPALRTRGSQSGVDVGGAAGLQPVGAAASVHRPGHRRPRPR
jgi:hypothetical protein